VGVTVIYKDKGNVKKKLVKRNTVNNKNPTNYNLKLKKQMTTKLKPNLPHKKEFEQQNEDPLIKNS
jgi:hypothetical protein